MIWKAILANITLSDTLENFVPVGPMVIKHGKKKLLTWGDFYKDDKKKTFSLSSDKTSVFKPYEMGRWDFHRSIVRDFNKVRNDRKAFDKWVPEFAECCGDLLYSWPLKGECGLGSYLDDWFSELTDLADAIEAIDSKNPKSLKERTLYAESDDGKLKAYGPPVLSNKLKQFTFPDLDFKHQKRSKDSTFALGSESLLGFCWLLVAREVEMKIKYVPCRGFSIPHKDSHSGQQVSGCGRLVPDISPKGNPMTVCSKNCSARAGRLAQKIADDMESESVAENQFS